MSRGWAGLAGQVNQAGRIGPVKASGPLGRLLRSRTGSADARKGPIGLMGAWAAGGPGWRAGCMGSRTGPAEAREWASGSVGCGWAGLSAGAWGGARIGPVKAAGLGRGRKMPGHVTAWVRAGLGVVHNAEQGARRGSEPNRGGVWPGRGWACTCWCVFRQRATKRSQRQALIARGVVLIARCERQY